ncbi:MAG: DUF5615 family PIN-like protein [Streptosporangiaceae bacterium]
MKFLIDNNLSPLLAEGLKAAGHDAVHLRDLGMQAVPDPAVLQRAQVDGRVLVSADTDFGGLLSRSRATGPSVLLIRRLAGRHAAEQSAIILANLDQIAEDLATGAVVVIGDDRIRIRHDHPPAQDAWPQHAPVGSELPAQPRASAVSGGACPARPGPASPPRGGRFHHRVERSPDAIAQRTLPFRGRSQHRDLLASAAL